MKWSSLPADQRTGALAALAMVGSEAAELAAILRVRSGSTAHTVSREELAFAERMARWLADRRFELKTLTERENRGPRIPDDGAVDRRGRGPAPRP